MTISTSTNCQQFQNQRIFDQVCFGFEPRHRVRAAVEAKVLGQADGEGQRLVSQDARVGLG